MAIGGTRISKEEQADMIRDEIAYASKMAQSWTEAAKAKEANGRLGMAAEDMEMAEYWNRREAELRTELASVLSR